MFKCSAKTVATTVDLEGVGLHSGQRCRLRVHPASPGSGLCFSPWGSTQSTRAHWSEASAPGGATRLGGWLETPEHLLAAVVGLGITDVRMEVDGGEIPALDGSARPFVEALGVPVEIGLTEGLVVREAVEVRQGEAVARLLPSDQLEIAVEVDFGPSLRGAFEGTLDTFVAEWSWARTFLPHGAIDTTLSAGRGRGARPGNVVVWGERGPLVPVRSPDEPIRHKALDALGDLALAGCPVRGRLEVHRGTHALHQAVIRAWLHASLQSPTGSV